MDSKDGRQITTISFSRYSGFKEKLWAFRMMRSAHDELYDEEYMSFYKLMGTGKGFGFNPFPDWSVYCLLQVWENENIADAYFERSRLISELDEHSSDRWTIFLKNINSHGEWSGTTPFTVSDSIDKDNPFVAVITRATIKTGKLIRFWKQVPHIVNNLKKQSGLIYTKGIGEVPVKQMATFSLWENSSSLNDFAYENPGHKKAIRMTRSINWFSEELFARFQPFKSLGKWPGINIPNRIQIPNSG